MRIKLFEDFEYDGDFELEYGDGDEYLPNVDAQTTSMDEINGYIDNYLAYLKDDGFTVFMNTSMLFTDILLIQIYKSSEPHRSDKNEYFKWDEVGDYLIPFLEILQAKFDLREVTLINDKFNYNKSIEELKEFNLQISFKEIRFNIIGVSEYKN